VMWHKSQVERELERAKRELKKELDHIRAITEQDRAHRERFELCKKKLSDVSKTVETVHAMGADLVESFLIAGALSIWPLCPQCLPCTRSTVIQLRRGQEVSSLAHEEQIGWGCHSGKTYRVYSMSKGQHSSVALWHSTLPKHNSIRPAYTTCLD
jgi:hypothetical protein